MDNERVKYELIYQKAKYEAIITMIVSRENDIEEINGYLLPKLNKIGELMAEIEFIERKSRYIGLDKNEGLISMISELEVYKKEYERDFSNYQPVIDNLMKEIEILKEMKQK